MKAIHQHNRRLPAETIRRFHGLSTPVVADALGRLHAMSGIRHYNRPGTRMTGFALTVRTAAGDNLMIHKAIDMAKPGDVLVIEADGYIGRALLGEIICTMLQARGVAGVVADGAIRDATAICRMDFPVYAKGVTPAGPFKEGPGEINVAVQCAGAVVQPGDIVIGDDDGIVVVPAARADEALQRASDVQAYEERMMKHIREGTLDRSWVDNTLRMKGLWGDE